MLLFAVEDKLASHLYNQEIYILIDVMLSTGLDTRRLHSQNRLVSCFATQERVGSKTFPIPTALSNPAVKG